MHGRSLSIALATLVLVSATSVPAFAAKKDKVTFKNNGAVPANDFTLVMQNTALAKNASFKNLANQNPFLPDQTFNTPVGKWISPQVNANTVAAGGKMTVQVEIQGGGATDGIDATNSTFTSNGNAIATGVVLAAIGTSGSGAALQYVVSNPSATKTLRLTNIVVRKNDDNHSLFGAGEFVPSGGVQVSSTAGPVDVAPGGQTTFSVGTTSKGLAYSIYFDAADASVPADTYATGEADAEDSVPAAGPVAIAAIAIGLVGLSGFALFRRRALQHV